MLIPDENTKDLAEIPAQHQGKARDQPVKWIDEVLQVALRHMPQPVVGAETEAAEGEKPRLVAASDKRVRRSGKRAH